ncbi:DNA alkylation repair protein [Salipiger pallidus]|uniref:DNA alkylation repair protein n=1 Tax=Salipiger pallidus TaxID=1775170 RepID=A0A8J3EGE8_9RHOB|nr:DNA alkylation repair protein [Salipiger pallidus]GGG76014.1 DNA alkylation repair protein [Salipiger pallidus]
MSPEDALAQIEAQADPGRAEGMAEYHKVPRRYIGTPNSVLNDLAQDWRRTLSLPERQALADALWATDIFEARVVAAKLLTQARIRDDGPVWDLLRSWVPEFDSWAIADHAASAIGRRLVAEPARLETVEGWVTSDHMWTRRAALVATLPWAKLPHPSDADFATRDRILGWAAELAPDRDRFIQKAVSWWLRDLGKHDAPRAMAFLDQHGTKLTPAARKDASRLLR